MARIGTSSFILMAAVLVAATVFVRLGFWQLDRLEERRTINLTRQERLEREPLELGGDGSPLPAALHDSLRWTRVSLTGRYLPASEIVLRARRREGRAGVEVVTPLVVPTAEADSTAVLVLRGWLPAADGLHPDLAGAWPSRAASVDTGSSTALAATVEGTFEAPGPPRAETPRRIQTGLGERIAYTTLDLAAVARDLGRPVARLYLRARDPGVRGELLEPAPAPRTDDGPHLSYAIQWFAFALIFVIGGVAYVRKEQRR